MKPHKHAEFIHAWADGATIQYLNYFGKWEDCGMNLPAWDKDTTYRIKPEPKPDVVDLVRVFEHHSERMFKPTDANPANLKLTFDGETGKLKAAEVIE